MKNKQRKLLVRIAAMFIVVCMVLTTFTAAFVSAEPLSDTSSVSAVEPTESENSTTDQSAAEEVTTADEAATESTTESTADASSVEETSEADGSDVVNFVVIDQPNVSLPDTQKIAISAGENEEDISEAKLVYGLKGSDEETEVEASKTQGDTALFEISCGEETTKGVYRVKKFSCKIGDKEFVSDFEAQNLVYEYGVEDDSQATQADAYIVPEEDSDSVDLASEDDADVSDCVAENSYQIVNALKNAGAEESDELDLAADNLVICLDPGHDSTHGGASKNGLNEEELTLKIGLYLKSYLEQYPNVTVYMTRSSAACPIGGGNNSDCLQYRTDYAKSVGADVFISLHINDEDTSDANGALICVPNSNYRADLATVSHDLAEKILAKLVALGMKDLGYDVRNGDETYPDGSTTDYLHVIRESKKAGIPGILIEHGFIGGSSDTNLLNNDAGLQSLALADAQGIAEYYALEDSSFYAPVFDATYYWTNNTVLQSVYSKTDTAALLNHFIQWGMDAGLQASANFNVDYYRANHSVLEATYGNNLRGYYLHYIRWGQAAGWKGSLSDTGTTDADTSSAYTTQDGFDYAAVYDPEYYWTTNKALLQGTYKSTDYAALLNHFVQWGMTAGLQASAEFRVQSYKNRYPELVSVYGDNLAGYYLHYCRWGRAAGLDGTDDGSSDSDSDSGSTVAGITVQDGFDYAAVYNAGYYWTANKSVLSKAYKSTDYAALLNHFVQWGMDAGLQAKAEFDVEAYENRYPDLKAVYGDNLRGYYIHYCLWGQAAGLDGTTSGDESSRQHSDKITILNGVNYSAVYDPDYYWTTNKEVLQNAYSSTDYLALLNHFVQWGMAAGLRASEEFDVDYYKSTYTDLQAAYGDALQGYYLHYIRWGKEAGLYGSAEAADTPVTSLDGQDYSAVYDYDYYLENNPSVKTEVGTDRLAVLRHFVNTGMNEGLQAIDSFNVYSYRAEYSELRSVYGNVLKGYYLHYIWWGKDGGLNGNSGATWTPVTTLDDVDYSAVYDYDYYLSTTNTAAYVGYDETAVLQHFVYTDMPNGVQGNADFNPSIYKSNYPDLVSSYGSYWPAYYLHYIWWGKAAGWNGKTAISVDSTYAIMGTSSTTAAQMARYFKAATTSYPSFYANTDAADIETFCQILYEEAEVEGVRAEVVMAQAMLETGFLTYTGDVDISQFNFAGLGATGGVSGDSFADVRTGLRAQVQHLKAYASTEALHYAVVDNRFSYVDRGSATTLAALSQKWASDSSYGTKLATMIVEMLRA